MKVAFKTKELEQLYITPLNEIRGKSLNFEALSGKRKGQFSIRLNKQFRLIIIEAEDELIEIEIIEISKHYE
jgi:plasmid maintenance system killer protein